MNTKLVSLHPVTVLVLICGLAGATILALTGCRSEPTSGGTTASARAKASGAQGSASISVTATARASAAASGGSARSLKPGAPLDEQGRMQIGDDDRCPVCAMRVKERAKFSSAIALDDGTTHYFCGTGCMLRSWLHPDRFLGVERKRLDRGVVREYFTGKHLDAATVLWVAGSDVVGPMGPAIVPLADDEAATTFKQRHGGKATFKLGELTDERWEQMTGKKAAR